MKDAGLKEPEFFNDGFFGVRFFGPDGKLIYESKNYQDLSIYNLNKRQLEAYTKMVNEKQVFNYKKYCEYFNISKSTAKRDLQDLLEKNLVKKELIGKSSNFSAKK